MKLISLRLQNFRQHADSVITFAPDGITAIVGKNESGKSSILEAIAWCLYGARATRGTMRGLRWHRAPARRVASAVLEFEVGGRSYSIERTETSAKLTDIQQGIVIAEGTDAVNRYVPELLGMRLEEFTATYMAAQKDLARMASMGPTERQAFIRGVLGLDRIDAALKACRARKNDLARERDGLAAGLGDREQLAADVRSAGYAAVEAHGRADAAANVRTTAYDRDVEAQRELAESQKRADRHGYLGQNERHLRAQIETADREIERVEHERQEAAHAAEIVEQRSAPLARLPALRERHVRLIQEYGFVAQRAQLQARIDELDSEIARLDLRAEELGAAASSFDGEYYATLPGEIATARSHLDGFSQRRTASIAQARQAAEQEAKRARTTERKLEAIHAAGHGGACPTCTRELGDTYQLVIDSLETDLSEARLAQENWTAEADRHLERTDDERLLSGSIAVLEGTLERLRNEQASAEAARKTLAEIATQRARLSDLYRQTEKKLAEAPKATMSQLHLEQAIHNAGAEIAQVEALEKELAPLRANASRIDSLAAERNERVAARADTVEHVGQVIAELRELAFDASQHDRIEQAAREASEQRQKAEVAAARSEEAYRAAQAQCDRAERALADYDARAGRLQDLTRDLRTHTAAAERLDAFRVAQASAIRPELEELTTGFVSLLTDGRHDGVTITEDFDLVLSESGVDTEIVSGGTEDIAALAMRLAISQMIAMRAGHPLSLLALDEPFGSLDDVRRGNVLTLLRRLRATFEQTIIISHVAESKDLADHVIQLEYDESEGRSSVVQSTASSGSLPEPALAEAVA